MADKYTIADVPVAPDPAPAPSFKERMITLEKDVKQTESFTVAQLEGQMASCDSQIENLKKQYRRTYLWYNKYASNIRNGDYVK